MLFSLAIQGDLEQWVADFKVAMLRGVREATEEEGRIILELLREDVRDAGLGDRLPNTWRLDVLPGGGRLSYNPVAFIHSKAAKIIDAFERGVTIKGKDGGFLAVPVPDGPMDRIRVFEGEGSIAAAQRVLGELRFVPVRQGLGMLVAARTRLMKTGRRQAVREDMFSAARADHEADVPVFFLVPQVRLEKRLSWREIAERGEQGFANRVETRLRANIAAMPQSGARAAAANAWFDSQGSGFSGRLSTALSDFS